MMNANKVWLVVFPVNEPQGIVDKQIALRRWPRAVAVFSLLMLVLAGYGWSADAAPPESEAANESLAEPPAPQQSALLNESGGFFSLTANRTYSSANSPRVWLDYRNLGEIDFRVYRLNDPAKFFRALENKHQMGEEEKDTVVGKLQAPTILEAMRGFKDNIFRKIRNFVRGQIDWETRRDLNRYIDRKGTPVRRPLNVADYARAPLLNPGQMVTSWREKLPEKVDEYDRRMVPLGKREPGVYLVEAVSGGLRAYTVAIVSDLVMVNKTTPDGQLFVHTINRKTGEPRSGAAIEVVKNRQSLNGGITDANGNFTTTVPRAKPTPARANAAEEKNDDYIVIAQDKGHFAISDLYAFSYQDEENSGNLNLRGYIYTDRPVYRPGHKVSFKGILRDLRPDGYSLLAQKTIKVVVEDEENTKVLERVLPLSPRGTFSGEYLLPAAAKLGGYNVKAIIGEDETYGYFSVEEYKKPEYKVTVTTPGKFLKVGTKTRFQVEAKYFFGAPVTNAEVKYYVYRTRYYPNWWDDEDQELGNDDSPDEYDYEYSYNSETVKEGTGATDGQGRLYVDFDVPQPDGKQGGWDWQYRLEANVTDAARRAIDGSGSFVAIRSNIKSTVSAIKYIARQGEQVRLVVRSSDYEGKPLAAQVRLQFVERNWEKVKKKTEDGYEYDAYVPKDKDITSVTVNTSAQGETVYDYTPDRAGYIKINSYITENGKEIESLGDSVWVSNHGDAGYEYSYPNYGSITMIPDKKSYLPGETAKVLVMLPENDANLLVTTELTSVMSARNVQVKGRSVVIDVPIEEKYAPNVYLNVSFVKNNELYTDDQMLAVPAKHKTLDVTLIPNKQEYQPRETVTYQVVARNADGSPATGAEISVGVVDEAIYSIRGDYDNIKREFYGRRYNQVDTNFTTSFYFQGYAGAKPAAIAQAQQKRPNSLADFKNESLIEPTVRKNFKDTAFWQPAVITGADGAATVAVKLPDNLTTWRATARAVTADTKVGQTITRVVARKGVIIRLATPRFVTAGDTVTLSGIVHNYLAADKRAQVSLSVSGGGQILDNATQSVTVTKNGEQRIDWRVQAPPQSGELTLLAKALTDTESDAVQIPLPVNPRGLRQANGASAILSGDNQQQELNFDIPGDSDATARALRIEAAPSVAASLFGALDYLTGYPYGCVEQTMSRFLPTVIVAQALKDVKTARLEDKDKLKDKVDKGLERLYNMQHEDGGWGWWKNDETDPFMTAYVVDGLTQAKNAGFDIENNRLERARKRLKELLGVAEQNDQFDAVYRANTRAYMVYAHTISGDSDAAIVNDLVAREDSLSHYGRALLALSLHQRKDARAAQLAVKIAQYAVTDKRDTEAAWQRAWTDYRKQQHTEPDVESTALSLKALSRITPDNPLLPKVASWLVTHRKFGYYWDSTRATAFAVSGLTEYLKASQELTPDYTVEVYLNGAQVLNQRATAATVGQPFVYELKGANLGPNNQIRVVKRGRGNLYLTAGSNFYAGSGDLAASGANGLQISREYLRLNLQENNGKHTWKTEPLTGEVKTGDLIVSRLRLKGAPGQYVMIEDPIPAGAEQQYSVGGLNLDYSDRNWSDWYSSREFRDNRTVYFLRWFDGDAAFQYVLRVNNPGDFRLVPARAEMMYDPDVKANSESGAIRFEDKK